jgi:rhodanese-related sulfurtransferase
MSRDGSLWRMSALAHDEHEVDPKEAERLIREEGWTMIDVREPYEREAGHVEGTRHVELAQLTSQAETIDRDSPVIFICHVGGRSGMAAEAFRASGYDAYNLRGGITAWVEAGLPITPDDGYVAEH